MPRSAARVEQIGPFTLFIQVGDGWPYYGRPTPGATQFDARDVLNVRGRQRELGLPETLEWVAETTPGLQTAIEAAGLHVTRHPLMVLDRQRQSAAPARADGLAVRAVTVDDDLALFGAIAPIAFGAPGTSVGTTGLTALRSWAATAEQGVVEFRRSRLRTGSTFMAVALQDGEPVGIGSHQPVGQVTELTGIGVLPAFRRRGIGAALTSFLVEDAVARGIEIIFLSAGDAEIARVYERVGFFTTATACIAEPAATLG